MIRDISVSLNDIEKLEYLINIVFNEMLINLKDVFIFDFYSNKDKNINKIGFRFIFQSKSQTLHEDDINNEMIKIFKKLVSIDGVKIPGYEE